MDPFPDIRSETQLDQVVNDFIEATIAAVERHTPIPFGRAVFGPPRLAAQLPERPGRPDTTSSTFGVVPILN
jgi:hypothetical protein